MKFRMEQCFSSNRSVLTNGKMGLIVEADTPLEAARKGMSVLVSRGVRPWLSSPGSEALVRENQGCGPSHFFLVDDLIDPPQENKNMNDYTKEAIDKAEFAKLFGETLDPKAIELASVTRTIRDLARAYLQANNSDSEYAESWQTYSHASKICNPLGKVIEIIVGEEIADRFWGHCEIDTMVSEYIDSHNS